MPVALLRDRGMRALLAVAVLGVAWYAWPVAGLPVRIAAYWPIQVALDVVLAAGSWRVARDAAAPATTRRFWRSMTAAAVLFTAGDLVQTAQSARDLTVHGLVSGDVHLVFILAGMALPLWTMLTHPVRATGRQRLVFWLDAATVMTAAAGFIWSFVLSAVVGAGTALVLLNSMLAAVMLILFFGITKLVLGGDAPFRPVAAGIALVGVALTAVGAGVDGLAPTVHPAVSMLASFVPCVIMAACPRAQTVEMRVAATAPPRRRRRPFSLLPYGAALATYTAGLASLIDQGLSARSWGLLLASLLVTLVVLGRQITSFVDNAVLLRRLGEQESRFRSLIEHSSDLTVITDRGGRMTFTSPAVTRMLGYASEELHGSTLHDLLHPQDRPVAAAGGSWQGRVRHRDGSWRWLDVVATDRHDDPSVGGLISNARDITEARAFQERLRFDATHDALTGLANRALFHRRIADAAEQPGAGARTGVLAVDLDDFKIINDTLGHHVGDRVLTTAAERLRGCVRDGSDTVARLGGDEFAVILTGTTPAEAAATAARIVAALSEPVTVEGHVLVVRASVGVATGPSERAGTLLRAADAAMYDAKRSGKGTMAVAGG
ncbi:diguanylate cyclase domain-containing protein [Actinoplanes nipponensis]|uniref:diguanylate cyclase domain-containing protein n=1 Tax=Actinoplanes nipponensis TaxID=135950 RepID=UPI00194041E3|nr:diguanylate cyclase [Actinoplanes nipponensis]